MANFINKTRNFPEEIYTDEQGLLYHIIKKGTKIYRGDSYYANKKDDIEKMNIDMLQGQKKVFFGFSQYDIENYNYGKPFEFEVIKEGGLRLLRVDDKDTLQKIYDDSYDEEIKKIIETHYILNDKEERDSKKEKDYAFIEYLCETYPNYDGYISDLTQQKYTKLNAEMAICDPISKVKLNRQLKGNKTDEQYDLDLTLRLSEVDREKKRKAEKTRPFTDREHTKGQKLFGGKKKSKKSKKSKKVKKQTRKKKGKKN